MLEKLTLREFTAFQEVDIDFSSGLNVIVGENGLGKSHLLKLGYMMTWLAHEIWKFENGEKSELPSIGKKVVSEFIAQRLKAIFRPEGIGRLVHRRVGVNSCDIKIAVNSEGAKSESEINFSTKNVSTIKSLEISNFKIAAPSIYIPPADIISMYPFIKDAYQKYPSMMDITGYDLALALDKSVPVGPPNAWRREMINNLSEVLGGRVVLSDGRFYLQIPHKGKMEIPLVAEGLRKIALLAHLVANGTIIRSSTLFWDEPESNLNPKIIVKVAEAVVEIARSGTQVVLATHSLFLLNELDRLCKNQKKKNFCKIFALGREDDGSVRISAGNRYHEVEPIVVLDEEIAQADRYIDSEGA